MTFLFTSTLCWYFAISAFHKKKKVLAVIPAAQWAVLIQITLAFWKGRAIFFLIHWPVWLTVVQWSVALFGPFANTSGAYSISFMLSGVWLYTTVSYQCHIRSWEWSQHHPRFSISPTPPSVDTACSYPINFLKYMSFVPDFFVHICYILSTATLMSPMDL